MAALANDYQVIDDPFTATFHSKTAAGATDTAITITSVTASELTNSEVMASQGFFNVGDKRFVLGDNQITAANKPKPGDSLVDNAGVTWEILTATVDDFSISWVVVCKKAR